MMPTTITVPAAVIPAIAAILAATTGGNANCCPKQRCHDASSDRRTGVLLGVPLRFIGSLLLQSWKGSTSVRITRIALCLHRSKRLHGHRRWLTGTAGQQGDRHNGADFTIGSHLIIVADKFVVNSEMDDDDVACNVQLSPLEILLLAQSYPLRH
jgi:hypothetical protein